MHLAFLFTQTLQPEEKKTKQPVGDCVISLGGPLSSLGLQPADQGHLKDFFFFQMKRTDSTAFKSSAISGMSAPIVKQSRCLLCVRRCLAVDQSPQFLYILIFFKKKSLNFKEKKAETFLEEEWPLKKAGGTKNVDGVRDKVKMGPLTSSSPAHSSSWSSQK